MQEALARILRLEIAAPRYVSDQAVMWYAIDHASYHGEVPGARMARGIVAGLPDVWFHWRGNCGVIELKARDGHATEPQCQCLSALRIAGTLTAICNDNWQVLQVLDAWGVPRAHRTRVA